MTAEHITPSHLVLANMVPAIQIEAERMLELPENGAHVLAQRVAFWRSGGVKTFRNAVVSLIGSMGLPTYTQLNNNHLMRNPAPGITTAASSHEEDLLAANHIGAMMFADVHPEIYTVYSTVCAVGLESGQFTHQHIPDFPDNLGEAFIARSIRVTNPLLYGIPMLIDALKVPPPQTRAAANNTLTRMLHLLGEDISVISLLSQLLLTRSPGTANTVVLDPSGFVYIQDKSGEPVVIIKPVIMQAVRAAAEPSDVITGCPVIHMRDMSTGSGPTHFLTEMKKRVATDLANHYDSA